MQRETLQAELTRLRKEQNKARRDEVFGGMTRPEQTTYETKAARIRVLEIQTTWTDIEEGRVRP